MSSTCSTCGAPLQSSTRFCTGCGTRNPGYVDPAGPASQPSPPQPGDATVASPWGPPAPQAPPAQTPEVPQEAPWGAPAPAADGYGAAAPTPSTTPAPNPYAAAEPQPVWGHPAGSAADASGHDTAIGSYGYAAAPPNGPGQSFGGFQSFDGFQPPEEPRKSRKGLVVLIGALALLLAAGGTGAWWFLLGGNDSESTAGESASDVDRWSQVKAITTTPELAWSWDVPSDTSVRGLGKNLVSSGDDGVKYFGADDQPLWSNDDIQQLYTASGSVGWGQDDDSSAVRVQLSDGKVLTTIDGWSLYATLGDESAVVVQYPEDSATPTAAKVVDNDGKDLYDLPSAEKIFVDDDALYVLDHDGWIARLDASSGTEKWRTEIDSWDTSAAVSEAPSVTELAAEDSLFVTSQDGIKVFGTADGKVTDTLDLDCSSIVAVGRTLGSCTSPTPSDDLSLTSESTTVFFDGTGRIGEITGDERLFQTAEIGGSWYLYTFDGTVYDATFKQIATLGSAEDTQALRATDEGFYLLSEDSLALVSPTGTETWSLDLPESDRTTEYPTLGATDDLIGVVSNGKLTAYQR